MISKRWLVPTLLLMAIAAMGCRSAGGVGSGRENVELTQVEISMLRERAFETLTTLAVDENPRHRANALEALMPYPTRARELIGRGLSDENAAVRTVAAMAVGQNTMRDLVSAVRALKDDPSPYVQAAVIYALLRCKKDVDPSLLGRLVTSHESPEVRAHAAIILGELGKLGGGRSKISLLRDAASLSMPNAKQIELRLLRLQLAEAMVKLGDTEQLQTIRAALYPASPSDLEATALAAQILGSVGDEGATDQLIYLIAFREDNRRHPAEVRLAAAASLAKLGQQRGSFVADDYVNDDNPMLRAQAANVYGWTGSRSKLPILQRMLKDPNPTVQIYAASAIVRMTSGS